MTRRKADDGLRAIIRAHLPMVHWSTIETGSTQSGVPDLEGCINGTQFWLECKHTNAYALRMGEFQVGWHARRWREGGVSFIAVRQHRLPGPRTTARDSLYLYPGSAVLELQSCGLRSPSTLGHWECGPSHWDWGAVQKILVMGHRRKQMWIGHVIPDN